MIEPYDPTDTHELSRINKRREDEVKRDRFERAEDVKKLMSLEWGRRLVWGMLGDAKTYQATFSTNAMTMARDEGRRSFGLDLLAYIQLMCPELYIVMLQESIKRQKGKERE